MLLKRVLHVFLLKSKLLFFVSKNSELKAKFLFKNKATKSSKNVPSLGGNVDWAFKRLASGSGEQATWNPSPALWT